jgi:hypothetical protein
MNMLAYIMVATFAVVFLGGYLSIRDYLSDDGWFKDGDQRKL